MKKLIIIIALLGFSYLNSEAVAPIKYTRMWDQKCNGGYYAFKEDGGVDSHGIHNIIIWCTCDACGMCPTKMVAFNQGGELDPTDLTAYEQLFQNSDASIGLGNDSGTLSLNFQVTDENFLRHYTVTWTLNLDGFYVQTIDRIDIQN